MSYTTPVPMLDTLTHRPGLGNQSAPCSHILNPLYHSQNSCLTFLLVLVVLRLQSAFVFSFSQLHNGHNQKSNKVAGYPPSRVQQESHFTQRQDTQCPNPCFSGSVLLSSWAPLFLGLEVTGFGGHKPRGQRLGGGGKFQFRMAWYPCIRSCRFFARTPGTE